VFYGESNETLGSLGESILDTGASIAYIPDKVLKGILKAYGKLCEESNGIFVCPCTGASNF